MSAMTAPAASAIGNALLAGFSPSRAGFGAPAWPWAARPPSAGFAAFGGLRSFGLRSFFGLACRLGLAAAAPRA